jgi:nucleosome assembly protein 1-like 1
MSKQGVDAKAVIQHSNGKKMTEKEIKEQIENALNVPVAIMKRVNALKNVQVKLLDVESKFYEELHLLECKYAPRYDQLYENRKAIINGEYEPTEDESKWALDDNENFDLEKTGDSVTLAIEGSNETSKNDDLASDLKAKLNLKDEDIKGIPDFWLQTFKSVELIHEMIEEYDEPILKHLCDLRVRLHDAKPYGYTLEFHFNENEYFTNKCITKSYELRTDVDKKDPFGYEGPDIYRCTGSTIDWKKGKNVTARTVKKKQKHKSNGTIRIVTKEIKQDSFFNFFDTPKQPPNTKTSESEQKSESSLVKAGDNGEIEEVDEESLLAADFEIGHFFKERLIPKAILYFTGEIDDDELDYDEYDDEEGEDDDLDDDDEDDDDDDDDEDDEEPKHNKSNKGSNHRTKAITNSNKNQSAADPKANPPECKQS